MYSTLNPKEPDPHDILVIAPDVVLVAPGDREFSNLPHDAMGRRSDPLTGAAFVDTTFRAAAVNNMQVLGDRSSIARRAMLGFIGLLLAVCIGTAAIAWQSYGDTAREIIARWAPQFVLTSSPPPENPGLPDQPSPPADQASAAETAPSQPAPLAQTPEGVAAAAAARSPEAAQSLQSVVGDLATMGHEIEQLKASVQRLKANQEQMSRDMARVPEQNLRPKISARPPRSAAAPVRKPMPPFPPPQAAVAPTLPQAMVPPQPPEPQPQARAQPQTEPVPRPPMPVR
jgi:hypothetical protein